MSISEPEKHFYILIRIKPYNLNYNVIDSFIVCATSTYEARVAASLRCLDEGVETWLNSNNSTCVKMDPKSYPEKASVVYTTRREKQSPGSKLVTIPDAYKLKEYQERKNKNAK